MPVLPSYRNKSINLHRKSVDWFLYEGNTGTQWVKLIECLLVSFLISCTFYLSSVLNVIRMSMPTVFFPWRAALLNYFPAEYFLLIYDLNSCKYRVNKHLILGLFLTSFPRSFFVTLAILGFHQ